jgi:hypothetical protein
LLLFQRVGMEGDVLFAGGLLGQIEIWQDAT